MSDIQPNKTVLIVIVDDDYHVLQSLRRLVKKSIQEAGWSLDTFDIQVFSHADELIELMTSGDLETPHILISDCDMPGGIQGPDLANILKSHGTKRIMLVSGNNHASKATELGVDFSNKPLVLENFLTWVRDSIEAVRPK